MSLSELINFFNYKNYIQEVLGINLHVEIINLGQFKIGRIQADQFELKPINFCLPQELVTPLFCFENVVGSNLL